MPLEDRRRARLEDPGAELLDHLGTFWERQGRAVLGAVGILAVVGVIAFFMLRERAAQEEQAAGKLAEASILFWQGEYARSLQYARQVSQQYASTPSGLDAHRLAGDDAYWNGDFKSAVSEYRAYLGKQKTGLLADAARRSLAYALESDRQFLEAAPLFDRLVGVFDRESSAEFLAAGARCYQSAGRPAEAAKRLQRLVDEFGETSYAAQARTDLASLSGAPR